MTLLVLAGTSDARRLLEAVREVDVIASLAGATRAPGALPAITRIGGFGGDAGFRDYLLKNRITGVVDATHPFAVNMTHTAAKICRDLGLPHLILQRPAWQPAVGDRWHFVDCAAETATIIPKGATVFLATGRQSLAEFSCLSGRHLLARVIDPPTPPVLAGFNGAFVIGTPPFSIEEEIALFRKKSIDWLVAKNAGGDKSRSKLDAARALGLPVVLINRPKLPNAAVVDTVKDALHWVQAQKW